MSPRKLHRQKRAIRIGVAQQLVGKHVCVDVEHERDGATAKWRGDLLAVAEPLSHGVSDMLVLAVADGRTVSISLATVARIGECKRPTK